MRRRAYVRGQVQGVGFRPFVWREATSRGVTGWVANDVDGVVLEVEGSPAAVASVLDALHRPPPLAHVEEVRIEDLVPDGCAGFEVRGSDTAGARRALVSPDTATCDDCVRELHDPDDRRYRYPFINCTNCGPRYTIVVSVPYDRSRTTMAEFSMCARCRAEYDDPQDRRFHAEPICCPACGPALQLRDRSGGVLTGDPVVEVAALLRAGSVVAVKGLGGYHLAVDAQHEEAVSALRGRKHRELRPFAVMVADLEAARELCVVAKSEQQLLVSGARPIVVLHRQPGAVLADAVAPGSPTLGVMLPYTPLHLLLLEAFGGPIVLTSGNLSDEPIAFDDDDAARRLEGLADAFLAHDRRIHTRVDDSVSKVVRDRVLPVRRSRGYVPSPIELPRESRVPILACGAALKNTFCMTRGRHAFVSHHVGDLDDYATLTAYLAGITHLKGLLDVEPEVVVHDLHPDYPSTRYAVELSDTASAGPGPEVELLAVQHHHAHIASCLADNGATGPVLGVAFDGVGMGTDGTAWGGEFLVADLERFTRVAHLAPVTMPGGDAAAQEPWRMAASHLHSAYDGDVPSQLAVRQRHGPQWNQVLSAAYAGINAPLTSSAGRLFDAVSSMLGIRDVVSYEGQAAIELEHVADASETGTYAVPVSSYATSTSTAGVAQVEVAYLVRAIAEDLADGVSVAVIAARFHQALADVVLDVCEQLRDLHSLATVALSGGVFQNSLLVALCLDRLKSAGFTVLTHHRVPPNDGGISLGQAAVAAALHCSSP